ncbi:MAG TPA: CBS domain-containing protein [Vicinamibacteria bacterium]|nr:CBS domain-containing protein [Vicinamibacteria bacterium]
MTPSVVSCREDDSVDSAITKMKEHQLRRIVVQDGKDRVAGIISLGDPALASADRRLSGEVLRAISR